MRVVKIIVSGLLLTLWLIASVILGVIAIITVFPAIMLLAFPELLLIWILPALFLLAFGGWFSEEEVNSWFKDKPQNGRPQ